MKPSTGLLAVDAPQCKAATPTGILLHQTFTKQAAETPENIAIIHQDRPLSYKELDNASDAVACRLQAAGVGPGALVALAAQRSPEMVIGILAILKAGAAYLPLDPADPSQRLEVIIEEARPAAILLQDQLRRKLPSELQIPILGLEEKSPALGRPIPAELSPESLAYVLYTSGSTGKPKGAMIPHRAVYSFLSRMQEAFPLRPEDRFMQRAAYTFDCSIPELFWSLGTGAAMVLARPGFEADPDYLVAQINAQKISTLVFVPSSLALFLEHPNADSCHSLKRVFCIGETLPADLVARIFAKLPDCEFYNSYGPTETTVAVTTWKCRAGDELLPNIPIGLPLPDVQLYILDGQMKPVAPTAPGELYIGGPQLGLGYLHRPDLTYKAFVPNPFGEGQLYKTGDLVCLRKDGAVEFHGRLDHQVKLHGLRIELGEIEVVLRKHPAVRDCVVVVDEDRLLAYVVAAGISSDDLREHAQQTLPAYMVPFVVVFLDKLPLTSHGKINRRALPKPAIVGRKNGPVAPRNALETQLIGIWERVLKLHAIGITDNFFSELGGNSLQAVLIFAEIDKALGKRLPLASLFEAPTVEKLAQKIVRGPSERDWRPLVAIQLQGKNPPFFAIHGGDGNVLFYRQLSELLGNEQPFYGFQAQGLDGNPCTETSVEAIAACYLQEIRNVQPRGPYLLGGYSFGGLLSYEIACELRAVGQEVAFLALFDTANPSNRPRTRSWMQVAPYRIPRLLSKGVTLEDIFEYSAAHIGGKLGAQLLKWNERYQMLAMRGHGDPAELLALQMRTAHCCASLVYEPRPYAGKITLFRSLNQPIDFEVQADLGWSSVAQGAVEVHDVPGSHTTLFSDHTTVRILAKKVTECIKSSLPDN
ncbi:MAG: amino acid adenylation domain-containing protein [Verrucomicrobia bacterium]|nr:amino acid adenylation domain-containing protein [Verrucomicrobiota bacterium]